MFCENFEDYIQSSRCPQDSSTRRVLTDTRLLITQAAYQFRDRHIQTMMWNPAGTVSNHYELTRSMFRQGQADALEVWQVREKLLSSENEALDALAQAVNARGALEVELGGKIEEIR